MLKLLLLALPLIPVALAHAPSPEGAGSAEEVRCDIRATPMSGGVRLEGLVLSEQALSGTYAFEVRKQGAGGTSMSTQSGEFETSAERQEVVGEVGLGLERGASYSAKLTISWPGGEVSCVQQHPDRV